ncbi:hypothetical protein Poly51_30410 [Rubripirellula tenax]|uniref:Uncharacterized protein n=1 Tax=Rubripirellula tenax TaxID=2528015 RepID=A0A5C6F163_9BACT|nr:hypothetical protein [Rubripirellula tenax]TWU54324.1 hypothetical protein Poly51_30410 [Rubripirellula tenax]
MKTFNGFKIVAGLALAVGLCFVSGCGSSEPEFSASSSEVEAFLQANPESANADMEPPPDPEM